MSTGSFKKAIAKYPKGLREYSIVVHLPTKASADEQKQFFRIFCAIVDLTNKGSRFVESSNQETFLILAVSGDGADHLHCFGTLPRKFRRSLPEFEKRLTRLWQVFVGSGAVELELFEVTKSVIIPAYLKAANEEHLFSRLIFSYEFSDDRKGPIKFKRGSKRFRLMQKVV